MEGGSCEMRGEVQGNLPSSQEMNHSGQVSQHLITMGRLESFCWMSGMLQGVGAPPRASTWIFPFSCQSDAAGLLGRLSRCCSGGSSPPAGLRGPQFVPLTVEPPTTSGGGEICGLRPTGRAAAWGRGKGTALGSIRSSALAVCVLWVATELRARARHWAQTPRAPRGTWRRTGSCAERMCSMSAACKDGRGAAAGAGAGRALASGRHRGWNPLCRWETRRPQTAQVVSWCSWR